MLFRGERVRTYFISWAEIRSHLQRKELLPVAESEGLMSANREEMPMEAAADMDHQEEEL